jgi:Na+-transporting methylmalonyl-CoA/oxaloacetate decarboxylase gamma subunit
MNLFNAALEVSLIGMAGIFLFMFIFYISIRIIDWAFPGKATRNE